MIDDVNMNRAPDTSVALAPDMIIPLLLIVPQSHLHFRYLFLVSILAFSFVFFDSVSLCTSFLFLTIIFIVYEEVRILPERAVK